MSRGIVLLSGGLDSTLCLLKLLKEGHGVTPVFVDYTQWSLGGEWKSFCRIVDWTENSTNTLLDRERIGVRLNWLDKEERVGSVWGRNIALVGLAAMWAYTHGNDYEFIALGNHKGDVGPDCKPGVFDVRLDETLAIATKFKVGLRLPVEELTTEDIGRELAQFGIPWNLMYSCYWETPCGYRSPGDKYRCPGCRRKAIAMEAGGASSTEILLPNCEKITYQSELAEPTEY